jgi:hypothetical protein
LGLTVTVLFPGVDPKDWPAFPRTFKDRAFQGFQRPTHFKGQAHSLEVYGEIPKEISGTLYRIMPDPPSPSFIEDDEVRLDPLFIITAQTSLLTASPTAVAQWRRECERFPD